VAAAGFRSPGAAAPNDKFRSHLWQALSMAMHELPRGLPLVQCGPLVSADPPLRQVLIKVFRALPVIPFACELQSVILCC
jgi:hypothetical protein